MASSQSSAHQQDKAIECIQYIFQNPNAITGKLLDLLLDIHDLSDKKIQAYQQIVLGLGGRLSPDQVSAITSRQLPDGVRTILGHAGCGKTTILALIAIFHLLCGLDVLVCAATLPATKHLLKTIMDFAQKVPALSHIESTFYVNQQSAPALNGLLSALPNTAIGRIIGNDFSQDDQQHVKCCRFLASTADSAMDPLIQYNFGTTGQGIMEIIDDASYLTCAETLAAIPTQNADRFRGLILAGDTKQGNPAIRINMLSQMLINPVINVPESFVALIERHNIQAITLRQGYRMIKPCLKFPSMHAYSNDLTPVACTGHQKISQEVHSILENLYGAGIIWSCLYLNVTDSHHYFERDATPACNRANSKIITGLVDALIPSNDLNNFVIIAVSVAQKSLLISDLTALADKRDMPVEALPKVCLPRDIQGLQADYVIFDATVSEADIRAELGLLADPRIMNMAFTRGRKATILVASDEILTGRIARRGTDVLPTAYHRCQSWIIANILWRIERNSRVNVSANI